MPPKRKATPWILGGCGCLLLLLIAATVAFYGIYRVGKNAQETIKATQAITSPTPADQGSPSGSTGSSPSWSSALGSSPAPSAARAANAPAGWKTYVNVKENLPAGLQARFVAFSFNYPPSFELLPQGESNFVKVEKYAAQGEHNTAQNFAVGYATFPPIGADMLYDTLLDQLGQQFKQGFHNYRETGRSPVTVGEAVGKAMVFRGDFNDANNTQLYGKTLLLHRKGKGAGVTIIMLATSLDPTIKSGDELGVKGETAQILQSFKFSDQ